MRTPRCWRQLLAIVLVAIILPAPVYANPSSTGEPASLRNEAGDDAASDQQAVSRELALFRGSAAERRKRAVPPFATIEAARAPAGTTESRNPHFAYNKTIPYRFVLVNSAIMP